MYLELVVVHIHFVNVSKNGLLCIKGHHQKSEKTTHGEGENICKSHI